MNKKHFILFINVSFFVFLFTGAQGYSTEYVNAYNYTYSKGITTAQTINKANMDGTLTRIAMAKMISNYAINVLGLKPDTSKSCSFLDVSNKLDSDYDYGVTKACQLGLMGIGDDGKETDYFNPKGMVTRGQWATVFSRALSQSRGEPVKEGEPYFKHHMKYLNKLGIIKNLRNPAYTAEEKRGNVMLMMYRADETLNYDNLKITGLLGNKNTEGVALLLDTIFKVANLNEQDKNTLKEIFEKDKSGFEIVNLIPENFEFDESAISDGIDPYYEYNGKRYISPDDTIYRYKDWLIRIYKDYNEECISLYNEDLNVIVDYMGKSEGYGDTEYHIIYLSHMVLDELVEDQFSVDNNSGEHGIINYNGNFIHADHWSQVNEKIKGKLTIPEKLNIFGEEYVLEDYGGNNYENFFGTKVELENKITETVKESGQISNKYTVRFKEYPMLLITYYKDLNFNVPSAVFKSNPGWKTDNNGNIIDINQTRQLTCYFGIEGTDIKCKNKPTFQLSEYDSVLRSDDDNYDVYDMIPLSPETMPFYKVKQAKIPGYYYFYAADGKYLGYWIDLGKPVVYVYDSQNRENVLNVELVKGGKFKHAEPQFTTGTSWNFVADKYSNIVIDNENYPYMYYTSTAPGYELNKYGRTVLGTDVEYFLNTKFDYIGLNEKEKKDFIEYWLPFFEKGSKYFISFKFNEELDPYAKLSFKYEPDNINRVFMEAIEMGKDSEITYSRDNSTDNDEKYLKKFKRGAFEALEWGAYFKSL